MAARLTTQVLVWVIGISVLIFAAATVLSALHESNQLFNEARENAKHNVDRNLAAISTGLWTFDKPALEATLAALTQYGSVVRATVRDSEGEVVATVDRSSDSAPPETAWDVAISGPGGSQRIGTLQVAESYRDVREAFIRTLIAGLVSELAKTGALAALLFLVIYRLITRHLQDLARQVAYLGSSDAEHLVALRRRPRRDELDTLVESINRFRSGRIDAEKALLNDISERKRIELELKRTQAELSEALEIAHLAYWEFDPARSEFTFNDQYYSLHRTRAAEVGGYRLPLDGYCRRLVQPEDRVRVKAFIEEALQAANDDPGGQLEMRILCADAVQRWMLVRCHRERLSSGEVKRLVGAIQDTTERKDAEDALQAAQSELSRVTQLSMIGQMAAAFAHEISQPLGAVVANGEAGLLFLARKPPDLEEGIAALRSIVEDGHRAASVIDGIRAMFKKEKHEKRIVSINPLIAEVLMLSQVELKRKRVSVQTRLMNDLPTVLADRLQLQEVIFNLISNAADAMILVPEGSRTLRLISERSGSSNVLMAVEDSGPGLDEQTLRHVFEPFFTTKLHGMGMGLSICRSIVEAHDGDLSVESIVGQGTTFRVILPSVKT